jgi:hypothetical protein
MKSLFSKSLLLVGLSIALNSQLSAITLTFGDSRYLGYINDGIPSNLDDTTGYINTLLSRPLGSGPTVVGTEAYTRSNVVSPAGAAELAGSIKQEGNATSINVTGFEYLVAKYDASNAGTYVWYVGDLTGVQSFQQYFGTGTQWEVSHSAVFNASSSGQTGVPDGGSTVALLGLALASIAVIRRKLI